ncbi:MAG TPA: twin-arginine translocation signal domain-containing protein [Acetobacteraceae bacterium]|jgi:hypothetical protein|nr:twin-arginine translocation signal domain-containing protein [Acetobacteraceae bacterium]
MSDKTERKVRIDRRLFLRGAGVAAVAAPLTASAEELRQPTNNQAPARYKESEHVKRFYELNRR